jgi:DNA repair protein RecO (recombination protein O)
MAMLSDRAICLRHFEYSETSQIVLLFSRTRGLVKVIAKGAHRMNRAGEGKFGGGIDLLDEADALFTDYDDRELNTIAEWRVVTARAAMRRSLRSVYLGLFLAELLAELFEQFDPHASLYARLSWTLDQIGSRETEGVVLAGVIDVLREAGVMPRIAFCSACDRPVLEQREVSINTEGGGVVCGNCESGLTQRHRLDARLLRAAARLWKLRRTDEGAIELPQDFAPLDASMVAPLYAMLGRHIEHMTGRRLRTLRRVVEV